MNQMIRWIGTAAMLLVLAGCGRKETQVVIRFWIITIFLVVLGLMTLKLR